MMSSPCSAPARTLGRARIPENLPRRRRPSSRPPGSMVHASSFSVWKSVIQPRLLRSLRRTLRNQRLLLPTLMVPHTFLLMLPISKKARWTRLFRTLNVEGPMSSWRSPILERRWAPWICSVPLCLLAPEAWWIGMTGTGYVVHLWLPADHLGSLLRHSFAPLVVLRPTRSGQVGSFHVPPCCHGSITRARSPVHLGWSDPNLCQQSLTELERRGLHNFCHPRTDPVVIMLVVNETGDKVILGRNVCWIVPLLDRTSR